MLTESDHVVDIESVRKECEDDPRNEQMMDSDFIKNLAKSSEEDKCNDIEEKREHILHMPLLIGRTQSKEKHKNKNSKKPPRPRKGPLLTTNDLRLVKEISELVMKKRARVERLKKLRALAARPSSSTTSNISLFSMIITILFFIVIIIQVFGSSKNSTLNIHEKPEPSTQSASGLGSS